jgi:hypothetical protein
MTPQTFEDEIADIRKYNGAVYAISYRQGATESSVVRKLEAACIAALAESSRAKTHGCAITNVCLKEYLEPVLNYLAECRKKE